MHDIEGPAAAETAYRDLPTPTLAALFAAEPDRLSRMVIEAAGVRFDFAKTHLGVDALARSVALAETQRLAAWRDALFAGAIVDAAGARTGGHVAERGQGAPDDVALARLLHARMRGLIDAIEAEAIGPFRHILHIGTGGSALGPALLVDALGDADGRYAVAVVSDLDGLALERALRGCDAAATLVVVASRSFASPATLLNAAGAVAWLAERGVADPYGQVVALTAAPDRAVAWGVDETRVLPFAESVGDRGGPWTATAFTAALTLGWDAFETLLEGAAAMDRHFRLAPPLANAPLLAAFADCHHAVARGGGGHALFAYDRRLAGLPGWVARLASGSAGAGSDGAGVVWGGVGSDAPAAVSRWLHRGAPPVLAEFVAAIDPGDALDAAHHHALLLDCFAQGAALMTGRADADPAAACPGDRASITILLDRVDPAGLGALLAFHEHRAFARAVLAGGDPFAAWDDPAAAVVRAIADDDAAGLDPSTRALIARAL